MEFEPLVSPIIAWVFSIGILLLLAYLIVRIHQGTFSPRRKQIKYFLNSLLFIALLFFMLNPVWRSASSTEPVLVFSESLDQEDLALWQRKLGFQETISAGKYLSNADSIMLLGTDFSKEFLYAIRAKSVEWIIPNSETEVNFLNFKGILRQEETQRIQGSVSLKADSELSVFQAGIELESFLLDSAESSFDLSLTAAVTGRNEWEIRLAQEILGTIRFFVLPAEQLRYQLQFGFPNPEIRTLSRFLIGSGERVQEEIQLSKNTALGTEKLPLDSVDVFVIDPSQLVDRKIQTQVERGASLLVINLDDPTAEIRSMNKAFGTDFNPLVTSEDEARILQNGLETRPFEWKVISTQRLSAENTVAMQQVGNAKIGVSLLTSSFQLAQSGDSVSYEKLWNQVLGELRPQGKANWKARGPIFQNQFFSVEFNGADSLLVSSQVDEWSQSLINPNSREKEFIRDESGWHNIAEGVEVYVADSSDWAMLSAQRERSDFLKSKAWLASNSSSEELNKSIPFWAWGLIFMILLSALWLEPKITR